MSKEVIAFVNESLSGGSPVALAILTESGRDTPGLPGSMMAVRADGEQAGTIGGGASEAKVVADCKKALADNTVATFSFDQSLKEDGGLGMICGGQVKGFVTIIRPSRQLIVFGGGHVGQKLYEAGLTAGFQVTMVEDREEYAPLFPSAKVVINKDMAEGAKTLELTGESYIVIVTRGHSQDFQALSAVAGSDAAYIGMIGSRKKVAGLLDKLRAQGVAEHLIHRIYSPVGLDIDDGTPGEIAIAVLAEILAVKNGGKLRHCRERMTDAEA